MSKELAFYIYDVTLFFSFLTYFFYNIIYDFENSFNEYIKLFLSIGKDLSITKIRCIRRQRERELRDESLLGRIFDKMIRGKEKGGDRKEDVPR